MKEATADTSRPLAQGTLRLQSDERLLKLYRRGIEPAFDELVRRYRPALVAYAGSIAGSDRAEDVVQESLVKAHRSLRTDRDIEPRPWLYTLTRNTALNDIRDNRKHRHADFTEAAGRGDTPADLFEQRERFAAVLAAVSDLPPAQRRALVDHELSGFSHEEIAAEMDLSTGATKQLIYRARISLRNAFGAAIPIPVIIWLFEGSGLLATGVAGGGATASGMVGGLGAGSAAKIAVVAVVAGGSLAGGIAVEKNRSETPSVERNTARAAPVSSPSPPSTVDSSQSTPELIDTDDAAENAGNQEVERSEKKSGHKSGSGSSGTSKKPESRGTLGGGETGEDLYRPDSSSREDRPARDGGTGSSRPLNRPDDSHGGGSGRPPESEQPESESHGSRATNGNSGSGRPPEPETAPQPTKPSGSDYEQGRPPSEDGGHHGSGSEIEKDS